MLFGKKRQIETLRLENEKLTTELTEARDKLARLAEQRKEAAALSKRVSEQDAALQEKEAELQELQKAYDAACKAAIVAEGQKKKVEAALHAEKKENQEKAEKIQRVLAQNEALNATIEEKEKEIVGRLGCMQRDENTISSVYRRIQMLQKVSKEVFVQQEAAECLRIIEKRNEVIRNG